MKIHPNSRNLYSKIGRPPVDRLIDNLLDEIEYKRVLDSFCIVETIDVYPKIFQRTNFIDWYPIKYPALEAIKNCYRKKRKLLKNYTKTDIDECLKIQTIKDVRNWSDELHGIVRRKGAG